MQFSVTVPDLMQALDSYGPGFIPMIMIYLSLTVLSGLLIALSVIDLKMFRLPNVLTFSLIALGLLDAYMLNGQFQDRLIGAALGYGVFVTIEMAFKKLRGKDGLGRGDAKLLAAGGAWCGWMGLPFIVLIGSGMGLIAALFPSVRAQNRIPFGPFLALGILIVWLAFNLEKFGILPGQ